MSPVFNATKGSESESVLTETTTPMYLAVMKSAFLSLSSAKAVLADIRLKSDVDALMDKTIENMQVSQMPLVLILAQIDTQVK